MRPETSANETSPSASFGAVIGSVGVSSEIALVERAADVAAQREARVVKPRVTAARHSVSCS